jgi:hypothetical protein
LELLDIYNKFHQVEKTPDIGWFSPISELTGQCIFLLLFWYAEHVINNIKIPIFETCLSITLAFW